jgi:hypothetical protein
VKVTTGEIVEGLKVKNGKEPEIVYTPIEKLKADLKASTDPLQLLVYAVRIKWAAGTIDSGNELWDGETKGYTKKSLIELL